MLLNWILSVLLNFNLLSTILTLSIATPFTHSLNSSKKLPLTRRKISIHSMFRHRISSETSRYSNKNTNREKARRQRDFLLRVQCPLESLSLNFPHRAPLYPTILKIIAWGGKDQGLITDMKVSPDKTNGGNKGSCVIWGVYKLQPSS